MEKQIDVYRVIINDNIEELTGVGIISFVESPAIERDFLKFSKDKDKLSLAVQDEQKRIATGAILIPDKKIYRVDSSGYEYFIYMTKEDIQKIVYKFFQTNKSQNVDIEHNGVLVNGVTMFESFITDKNRGINPPSNFSDLPEGTWFGSFYVSNETVWNMIKAGELKGFSICGLFDFKLEKNKETISQMKCFKELKELLEKVK